MPAVQKEILLQFFLGSPISVLDSLDYITVTLDIIKRYFSDGQLLHRIWISGPEGRRRLQLY